jgi:hypothetical protein
LVGASLIYSWLAAATTPFTTSADVFTAIPIAAIAVLALLRWRVLATPGGPVTGGGSNTVCDSVDEREKSGHGGGWWAWGVLIGVFVGWELFALFSGPRTAHPTASSIFNLLTRWHAAKAVAFFLWLGLGGYLVNR